MNLEIKTITIEPQVLLQWLKGERLALPAAKVSADAKLARAGYNAQRNEFWAEIQAESFDDRLAEKRMPQEFHAEIAK
jgi:hypothetical protein